MSDVDKEIAELWSVVTKEGKTLLKGAEADAKRFVETHFPWLHVQTGSLDEPKPDVKVVAPNGAESTYNAGAGGWNTPDDAQKSED